FYDTATTHPHLPSIYGPVAQLWFAGAALIERAIGDPQAPGIMLGEDSVWRLNVGFGAWPSGTPLRIALACAALLATVALLAILLHENASPWWAVLFAWNPLTVLESGAMLHVDIVGVIFLLMSILAARRGNALCAGAMLALSAGVKPGAVALIPWLIRDLRGGRIRAAVAFMATLASLFVPVLAYQHGYRGYVATLYTFATNWEFNGSIFELFTHWFGQGSDGWAMVHAKQHARILASAVVAVTALIAWFARGSVASSAYWLFLVAALVSPVVYPWYLLWLLALVPVLRGQAGWATLVWSGTVVLSYVVWHRPTWRVPPSIAVLEYSPVFAALLIESALVIRRAIIARQDRSSEPSAPCS
ncbi:MAG: glycosyltransferase 87 family protein, partial [Tepidisphaeraceae bacterium]